MFVSQSHGIREREGKAMKNLARCVGIAAALAGVAVAGAPAKAEQINIFAWTNAAPLPVLLQSGTGSAFTLTGAPFGGATFNSVSVTDTPPNLLDSAQTITLALTGTIPSTVHIGVEVAGLTAPFTSGLLDFLSGFAVSNINSTSAASPLNVTESTHLGAVCALPLPAVGGSCSARDLTSFLLATHTFNGPSGADSNNQVTHSPPAPVTGLTYTVFNQFDFTGGVAGDSANVNITLQCRAGSCSGCWLARLAGSLRRSSRPCTAAPSESCRLNKIEYII